MKIVATRPVLELMRQLEVPKRKQWTPVYGTDLDAMETFYGGLLGFEKQSREGDRHVFFRLDDSMLLVFNPHPWTLQTGVEIETGRLPESYVLRDE